MPNERWRDTYDSWKTRSDLDEIDEECLHIDFDLDERELFMQCNTCGYERLATADDVLAFRARLEEEKEEPPPPCIPIRHVVPFLAGMKCLDCGAPEGECWWDRIEKKDEDEDESDA
jgi:hypothetical protein